MPVPTAVPPICKLYNSETPDNIDFFASFICLDHAEISCPNVMGTAS